MFCSSLQPASVCAADGALDPDFGTGGVVVLPQFGYHGIWMPTDVAVQSDGKIIVSGWNGQGNCFILRLTTAGELDTTFGGSFGPAGFVGQAGCQYTTLALRSDDRIIAAGSIGPDLAAKTDGLIVQFTANGAFDNTFASAALSAALTPAGSDKALNINRLVLDPLGKAIFTGSYTPASGNTEIYLGRIDTAGNNLVNRVYAFGVASPFYDAAYDVAIAGDGGYLMAGVGTSATADADCGVVSVHLDAGFDETLELPGNYGGNNNDYCYALAPLPGTHSIVFAGKSDFSLFGVTWQTATASTVDLTTSPLTRTNFNFTWDQSAEPFANGDVDTVTRVIVQPYDRRTLLIGSGANHASFPLTGNDIGVMRLSTPVAADTTFGTDGFVLVDVGSTFSHANADTATSAVLWNDRLIVVGTTQDTLGGTDIVALRFAQFDGIFKSGYE